MVIELPKPLGAQPPNQLIKMKKFLLYFLVALAPVAVVMAQSPIVVQQPAFVSATGFHARWTEVDDANIVGIFIDVSTSLSFTNLHEPYSD